MTWKRHGGRKVIIAPDGGDAWAPAKPRPDETLIRALARAHRWKRLLEEGRYRSAARARGSRGRHSQLRQPTAAAHTAGAGYSEAILEGRQPKGMQLEELTNGMPSGWEEQQKHFSPACQKSGHPGVATDNSLTMLSAGSAC